MANEIPLGKTTPYNSTYDKSLLFPIPRTENRAQLGLKSDLPFDGVDVWTGYELSWLNSKGKPEVAIVQFIVPALSPNIVESKSFKLYLNSFNQTKFRSWREVEQILLTDLSEGFGSSIKIDMFRVDDYPISSIPLETIVIDDLDIHCDAYSPDKNLLRVSDDDVKDECLCTHLLKSNCPVTGQPDWAALWIDYKGSAINHEDLLRYVVSYREHSGFHEHCLETIFIDIYRLGKFERLNIAARYTRRGGLDINPVRTLKGAKWRWPGRTTRQ